MSHTTDNDKKAKDNNALRHEKIWKKPRISKKDEKAFQRKQIIFN